MEQCTSKIKVMIKVGSICLGLEPQKWNDAGMLNCEIATEMCPIPRRVQLHEQKVKQEWQEPCMDEQELPENLKHKREVGKR